MGTAGSASVAARITERILGDLDEVGVISAAGTGDGVTRVAYTPEDAAARRWFRDRCRRYGLRFEVDRIGNCYGWSPSADTASAVPLLLGSHLDSVPNAGRFDGTVGVMVGLEVARYVVEQGLAMPLVAANFACEESTRFGFGTVGSKWLSGALDIDARPPMLDRGGVPLPDVLARARIYEFGPAAHRAVDDFAGMIEVHIDQGTLMTSMGIKVGVVSSIAGLARTELSWIGEASHSGARWREDRRDALLAAAAFVVEANAWWSCVDPAGRRLQLTVGSLQVVPNSPNTVPGLVRLIVDTRSSEATLLDEAVAMVQELARNIGRRHDVEVNSQMLGRSDPLAMDPALSARLTGSAGRLGIHAPSVLSLAGHDALVLGRRIPAAMLLVANPSGVSHAASEGLDREGLSAAVEILVEALPDVLTALRTGPRAG